MSCFRTLGKLFTTATLVTTTLWLSLPVLAAAESSGGGGGGRIKVDKTLISHGYEKEKGDLNMFIVERYVADWGLKEGLRELIQNAIDACVEHILNEGGDKSELKVAIEEHGNYHDAASSYREYALNWHRSDGTIEAVGLVKYDDVLKELVIANIGQINKNNLLLGGSGSIKQQNKLIQSSI